MVSRQSFAVAILLLATGCTAVGTGEDILVKASAPVSDRNQLQEAFSHLLVDTGVPLGARMISLTDGAGVPPSQKFVNLINKRYGDPDFKAAELNATIRDLNAGPPFVPYDLSALLIDKVAGLAIAEEKEGAKKSPQERARLAKNFLKSQFLNVPELEPTTAVHHVENGRDVHYYYPRLRVEFSSSLLSAAHVDRFSYLGIAIKLREYPNTKECTHLENRELRPDDAVRFLTFEPKAPDIPEYTRGTITRENQLQAKSAIGRTKSGGGDTTVVDDDTTTKSSQSRGVNLGADLSFTSTDKYVSELKDSIEARTPGIYQNGRMLLAEYRSIKNRRIGGTYTIDLMLEVPSCIFEYPPFYSSEPVAPNIFADVYLVGVVRHVFKRGFTGILTSVPEPENDSVFHQVVYRSQKNVPLWKFTDVPWVGKDNVTEPKKSVFTVEVYTGRDDARFVVRNVQNNEILGNGSGKKAKISIEPDKQNDIHARVEFLDIVISNDKYGAQNLTASQGSEFTIKKNADGSHKEIGNYRAP